MNNRKKILVSALLLSVAGCSSEPIIDLNKYVFMEASGYDGYGQAHVYLDYEAISNDYGGKIKRRKQNKESLDTVLAEFVEPMDAIRYGVAVSADKTTNLANGDTVIYDFYINEAIEEYYTVTFKGNSGSFKVEGLTEIEKFDAFSDLDVTVEGYAPYGKLSWKYIGTDGLETIDFTADKSNELSNGDLVTISISERKIQVIIDSTGKAPETASKQYVINGLEENVAVGTAQGFGGLVTVILKTEDGKILDVSIIGDSETPSVGGAALNELSTQIKNANSAYIDGVSGATFTSSAVKEATQAALDSIK